MLQIEHTSLVIKSLVMVLARQDLQNQSHLLPAQNRTSIPSRYQQKKASIFIIPSSTKWLNRKLWQKRGSNLEHCHNARNIQKVVAALGSRFFFYSSRFSQLAHGSEPWAESTAHTSARVEDPISSREKNNYLPGIEIIDSKQAIPFSIPQINK